jgi:hypothetical protein
MSTGVMGKSGEEEQSYIGLKRWAAFQTFVQRSRAPDGLAKGIETRVPWSAARE